jgi:hypothetical protein
VTKRAWFLGAAVLLAAGGLSYWRYSATRPISIQRSDVIGVRIQPVPEGPSLCFGQGCLPTPPMSSIREAIPVPLPPPSWQGPFCRMGSDVIVTLADGRDISYGPCHWPAAIEQLRGKMEQESEMWSRTTPPPPSP